jgi:uncharacterized membrane protein
MQVLLINQNATIERLAKLSSGKLGYELVSAKEISEVDGNHYGFVIVDSDLYNEADFGALKEKLLDAKYILIVSKGAEQPNGFDVYIEKPFLPTELVEIFNSLSAGAVADDNISEDDVFGDSTFDSFGDDLSTGSSDEPSDLGEADFSFDSITDDIKTSLDDDNEISLEEEPASADADYEELTLDPSSDLFEEESAPQVDSDFDAIDMDAAISNADEPDFDFDGDLVEDKAEEISLEDYQSTLGTDEAQARQDDFDIGEDFMREDTNIRESGMGNIVLDEQSDDFADLEQTQDEEIAEGLDDDATSSESQIFDEDEVNKLKDLLDETEEDKMENDDFSLDNIKIQNDELGSLTEESLAEALGVSVKTDDDDMDLNLTPSIEEDDFDMGMDDIAAEPAPTPSVATGATPSNNIEINPNQSITLSLDTIRDLLETADVTINITLSKKK